MFRTGAMAGTAVALWAAGVIGAETASASSRAAGWTGTWLPYPPGLVDTSHCSPEVAAILQRLFAAKSEHDIAAFMSFFCTANAGYFDASLGVALSTWGEMNQYRHHRGGRRGPAGRGDRRAVALAVARGRAGHVWRWPSRTLVFAVLAGLWVMHGMPGGADSGCHGAQMPFPVARQAMTVAPMALGTSATARPGDARSGVLQLAALAMQQMHGELCLSGQLPHPGRDALALLGLLALVAVGEAGGADTPFGLRQAATARRRAPPGAVGIRLLAMVCVSRM
jgi:hypothetical protein